MVSEEKSKPNSYVKPMSYVFSSKLLISSTIVMCLAYLFLVLSPDGSSKLVLPINNLYNQILNRKVSDGKMAAADDSYKNAKSIYEFNAKDIDGNEISLDKYKGRVALIVNVACACGLTSGNYPQLQELHKKYESQGLSVLGFPCNQFAGQEPNPEAEIKEFVKQFQVEFDMFSKVNVNGDGAHPLYKYLKSTLSGTFGDFIKWNFSKFLINRDGVPVKRYSPTTKPLEIENDIVKLLAEKPKM